MKFYLEGINILLPSCAQHISWKSARYILMFLIHKSTFALISPNMGSEDITNRILKTFAYEIPYNGLRMKETSIDQSNKCVQTESKFEPFIICANLIARLFVLIHPHHSICEGPPVISLQSLSFSSHFYVFMNQIHETVSAFPSNLVYNSNKNVPFILRHTLHIVLC